MQELLKLLNNIKTNNILRDVANYPTLINLSLAQYIQKVHGVTVDSKAEAAKEEIQRKTSELIELVKQYEKDNNSKIDSFAKVNSYKYQDEKVGKAIKERLEQDKKEISKELRNFCKTEYPDLIKEAEDPEEFTTLIFKFVEE